MFGKVESWTIILLCKLKDLTRQITDTSFRPGLKSFNVLFYLWCGGKVVYWLAHWIIMLFP